MAVIACEAGIGRGGGARKCDRKKGAGTEEGTPLPSPPIFLTFSRTPSRLLDYACKQISL